MELFTAIKPESEGGIARAEWTVASDGEAGDYPQLSATLGRYSFTIWMSATDVPCHVPESVEEPALVAVYFGNHEEEDDTKTWAYWDHQSSYTWHFTFDSGRDAIRFAEAVLQAAQEAIHYSGESATHPATYVEPNIFTVLQNDRTLRATAKEGWFEGRSSEDAAYCQGFADFAQYLITRKKGGK